ncbi:AAA ATPase Elf1, partial [Halocaridina rubra]
LADDLEIAGLKVSNLPGTSTSNNNNAILSSSKVFPTPLRPHLYCPSSPKKFTFSPISRVSPLSSALQARGEDFSRERSPHQDNQPRKRFRGEPLPLDRGGETLGSSPPSNSTTPPGSAPPLLPSTSFFGGEGNLSPPNSAPPQTFAHRPTPAYDHDSSTGVKSELSPLSLVSPLRLMEQVPQSSAPPSPLTKKESPSPCSSPSFMSIPNTPRCLALALKEPLTPSTPRTPTTPNSSDNSRVGNLNSSHSGCSTGSRVLLWRFLLDLLHNPRFSPIYIRWLDRPAGIFRIMESDMVAQLWGMARKNSNMNYEKMSRGMRTYYKRGILFHIDGTKLIYKFNTSDPEIQQRMRYYDLTQKSEGADVATEQQSSSNQAMSPTLTAFPNVPAFPNLPVAVTSSSGPAAGSTSIESLYSPFLRDVPQLPAGFLYDPYLNFLRASQRELY